MDINYISLGSFCHPKMHLRKTKREILKSLPFDFHSTPNTYSIYSILNKLHKNKTFRHKFKDIIFEHEHNNNNKKELAVIDEEDMYFLHFFDISDKISESKEYPINVDNNLNQDKIIEVNDKFQKRYEYLYNILNSNKNILVFLRIENYNNKVWEIDIKNLASSLKNFKHPNKFLIYTQIEISDNLDFFNIQKINYDYDIPIIFHKILLDENISTDIEKEKLFENILKNFENIINNSIFINHNDIIKIFYHDKINNILLNLNNINIIYKIKFINHIKLEVIYENKIIIFLKNEKNIYEIIS